MKTKPAGHRQGLLTGLLWIAAIALASQPIAADFGPPQLYVVGGVLDLPAPRSPIYFGVAVGGLLLGALWVYFLGLDAFAKRRSLGMVFLQAMAPCALFAAFVACYDKAQNGPTLLTFAGVPGAILVPPLLLLAAEALVRSIAESLVKMALARDMRKLGIRASLMYLRLKPDDRRMQSRGGLLLTAEDDYRSAIRLLVKLGSIRGSDDQNRLRAMERCFRALDRRKEASACLEELVRLSPMSQSLATRLLDDYLELGNHERALALLENRPLKDALTRLKLRQSLNVSLGRFSDALELIRKIEAYEGEDHSGSIALLRELLVKAPDLKEARIRLAILLLDADASADREEGAALMERILERDPAQWDLHRRLIDYYREGDRAALAQPHLEALVRAGSLESDIYLTLAQMQLRSDADDALEAAANTLNRMIEFLPGDWQGHVRLARIRLQQARIDEASAALAAAEKVADAEGKPSVDHLRNDIANWKRERKIADIRQAIAQSEDDSEKRMTLIDELVSAGKIDETLRSCEALINEHPEWIDHLLEHLETAIRRSTFNYRLCDYLSDLYFQQGRFEALLKLYRSMAENALDPTRLLIQGCKRILEKAPMHAATRQELALAYRTGGDWNGVIEALDPMLEAHGNGTPMAAEDRALWVEAAYRLGRLEEARTVGVPLAEELAGEAGFMLLMIDVLQDMKDHAGAYRIYQMANAALPDDPRLQRLARRIDYDRKRQRLDLLEARPAETLTPEEHYEKAELHREFGQHEPAIIHYQRAADSAELHTVAIGSMAVAMCERGMYDLAAETLDPIELNREIDQAHPDLKEMIYRVGRSMEAHKRFDKAVVFYKRIFRVDASFKDVVDRLQRLA